ncbi:MAG TPA: RdgB/HAM1 family non-canonical purine NTP pyrophosphatase [Phycisphaerae bacterium]|nr:RdgB/HAM1 family non-canonical purine NTP pyrophosphatase [Phycisphaerae bacterium]
MSQPRPISILIATGNPHKAREIVGVLSSRGTDFQSVRGGSDFQSGPVIEWKTLSEVSPPIPEPDEDGETFADNAALKARYYLKATGLWTLADDSGLEVDALGGRPGVRSARFAEDVAENAPRSVRDPANNRKLIALLRDIPPARRSARFRCALALADGQEILATAEGTIEGVIVDEPRGENGFGYDPHFFVPSLNQTLAEIGSEEKNRISHRARALGVMCEHLRGIVKNSHQRPR